MNALYKAMQAPIVQEIIKFKNSYNGNPKQEVEKLLSSGKMTQAQYADLRQKADMIQKLMHN